MSEWKMISDYVGFWVYILLDFLPCRYPKGVLERATFTLLCHQHFAFQGLPKFVFQTACIRGLSVRNLPILLYVCRQHLDQAYCILFKMQGTSEFHLLSRVHC